MLLGTFVDDVWWPSCAAIAAGADISVVARQLGHSDIKTTARYYLRPDLSVLKSLQRAWERLIIGVA